MRLLKVYLNIGSAQTVLLDARKLSTERVVFLSPPQCGKARDLFQNTQKLVKHQRGKLSYQACDGP
jgi:hypothetical protein